MAKKKLAGHPSEGARPLSIDTLTTAIGSEHNPPAQARQQRLPALVGRIAVGERELRLHLTEHKGEQLLELRLYELFTMARAWTPTAKGISIPISLADDLAAAISDAWDEAHKRGLISADAVQDRALAQNPDK
jgi:hypothetical protein